MTTVNRSKLVVSVGACVALAAGAAFAADLDPTGQAGQYATSRPATLVKGMGGTFMPSTLWVPFILQNDPSTATTSQQSLLNGVVVESVNNGPIAAVTSFGAVTSSTVAPRVVAVLQTTDAASTLSSGESNNVINSEGTLNRSSSAGSILPDGTLTVRENFASTGQSNLGNWNSVQSLGTVPGTQAPNKIIVNTAVNIGNAGETALNPATATVLGQVQLGTPSTTRFGAAPARGVAINEDLYTGQTHFNGAPTVTAAQFPATMNGVVVYRGLDNSPVSGTPGPTNNGTPGLDHEAGWAQNTVPLPTSPAGETFADARQSAPIITAVNKPGGGQILYVVHGIGFSGGTPFNGGSARVLYLAVDTVSNPDGSRRLGYVGSNATKSFNTILIEGDDLGAEGAVHGRPYDTAAPADVGFANHFTSDLNMKFVDHQATGGGTSFTSSQFDMNSSGQIAALWVNEGVLPERYEVRVYDPVWDMTNQRIEGFTLGKVVTFNGDVGNSAQTLVVSEAITTIEVTPGVLGETSITPMSGPAIDDNGRVSFVAIKEVFSTTGDFDQDPFTDNTRYIQNTTNVLYVWDDDTDTLHEIAAGGQNGDVLPDAFPGDGPPNNESLVLGFFPVDEASDAYNRDGLSRDGRFLAVNFRSGGNETVNGANVELETLPTSLPPAPPDTFNDNGGVLSRGSGATLNERAVRGSVVIALGQFVPDNVPTCCPGDADSSGVVNFADVTSVLSNFNSVGTPGVQNPGDSDCSGVVNFADITTTLSNFNLVCP